MSDRTRTTLSLLAALALLAACDATRDGARAYRDGRFEEARAAFAAAVADARADASAELLFDEALAELATGDLAAAEASAARARAKDAAVAPLCDFLLGNVAFARCGLAAKQADTVESEPFAFDAAIAFGESARARWVLAATSRDDWPAARRNVERAAAKIAELSGKKTDAADKKRKARAPQQKPTGRPAPSKKPADDAASSQTGKTPGKDDGAEAPTVELSPAEVLALFEKLAEKEKEKLALRRTKRLERGGDVEKDW